MKQAFETPLFVPLSRSDVLVASESKDLLVSRYLHEC